MGAWRKGADRTCRALWDIIRNSAFPLREARSPWWNSYSGITQLNHYQEHSRHCVEDSLKVKEGAGRSVKRLFQ